MPFKFEKLEVWHESMDLADRIDAIAEDFPKKEMFNLYSQIRRAADSVSLNIAEGSTSISNKEQIKYLNIAIRSCNEVACCIYKAKRRSYIIEDAFTKLYSDYERLVARIQALKKYLNKK